MAQPNEKVTIRDARIIFRNFEGREGQYNRAGDRNFSVVLDDVAADALERDGWNVKRKPPRDDEDEPFNHLQISVDFKVRPPTIYMITSGQRTILTEDLVSILDGADIVRADLIFRAYQWTMPGGKSGIKAKLHKLFVTIEQDDLEQEYADIPIAGSSMPGSGESLPY